MATPPGTRTNSSTEDILIPGEPEYRSREEKERDGRIPVTDAVWAAIGEWAKRLGVEMICAE